jgi:hypothetical protein
MRAWAEGGFQACGPKSKGLLMPSTAEEDFADCQSMNSRTLTDFRWGFERLSFMLRILRSLVGKWKAATLSGVVQPQHPDDPRVALLTVRSGSLEAAFLATESGLQA